MEALRASPVFRRICGFVRPGDIPSEATFSRAFGEFARQGLGERVHEALVARYVQPELMGHISRDATGIRGREKPTARERPPKPAPQAGAPEKRPTDEISWLYRFKTQKEPGRPAIFKNFAGGSFGNH